MGLRLCVESDGLGAPCIVYMQILRVKDPDKPDRYEFDWEEPLIDGSESPNTLLVKEIGWYDYPQFVKAAKGLSAMIDTIT